MNEDAWRGIRDRVLRLAGAASEDQVFASGAHGFALESPMTEDEIAGVESALQVRLPEEYRSFLRQVGAGGAGPAYGVFPLRQVPEGWEWAADETHRTDPDRLREPFTPHHVNGRLIDPLELRMPYQYDFEYRDDYEAQRRRWHETLWHPDRTAGAVCLCDEGCLRRYWLVVTGDERGMIWRDHRVDGVDLAPLFDPYGKRLTFGRWYLNWLVDAETQAQR
ncbi:hypothetical protein Val02_56840 [Virgisporangium aliadipatigenens]|uniref:Knr4/Smi1-like domain-containing protein n=1 Tax=Virgisporangium aliadipatigenens TaxID=741659 RepID=A0A8J3YR29_9ACTN|nr:SMI1/KNR4 family protein [Virgisporangium aliadipatigenens]GIJ48798.1 hypothetical protein Val02_56840 [Virgisporangium aliadipatigenens]